MRELSPPPLNLKRLYEETLETEPILLIISAGADPSQELLELAGQIVGRENYHEELNSIKPKAGFRIWLTAEVHVKFTPILLQSSLKVTYEVGLKKNLKRTYESWSSEQISKGGTLARAQALFCLAWFHAVCQERRNYIPQVRRTHHNTGPVTELHIHNSAESRLKGWTKFYEFSLSDLRAGFEIVDRLFEGGKVCQWEYVHGLLENAIYGGRIDHTCDLRVLRSYLQQFFNAQLLAQSLTHSRMKKTHAFPAQIHLPNSCSIAVRDSNTHSQLRSTLYRDYRVLVDSLPEDDKPSFFGLPANIERSAQRIISSQGSALIHQKVTPPSEGVGSPVLSFVQLEQFNAVRLVQNIHQSLASLSKVIRGTSLLTADVHKLATALLNQECPLSWQNKWEGPEDPMQYLRAVVSRALAIQGWVQRAERGALLSEMLDLSELFHPDTFLNALRQETARLMCCSMDSLKFVTSWRGQITEAKLQVKVGGLQLEGCSFDGSRLAESHHDSPIVSAVPACYMAWIPQSAVGSYSPEECISLPVYSSSERLRVVTNVQLPCAGAHDTWIQSGAALFLKLQ
ncbi:Cytoplasmic dynein 2 heavy chain 1 [Triplophysa tibetana]|uniref:Cytoplasmic dynein 2 heavy chain 1 n=1 Tax=Triplophysa tibetana TaxID=1572043 RepID=A0A5A9MZR5_9TELE|nr:Cytoplasmic dynein 2 heavy chain 1 [Triplophysa tibetana]